MESCVKNCGVLIHDEVATKAFMEEMRELVKQTTDDNIKNKVRFMGLPDPDPLGRGTDPALDPSLFSLRC
jgi:hypothetical protein